MSFQKVYALIASLLFSAAAFAQSTDIPLGSGEYPVLDRLEIKSGGMSSQFNASDKPISRKSAVDFVIGMDSLARKNDSLRADSQHPYWSEIRLSDIDRYNMRKVLANNGEWAPDSLSFETSKTPWLKTFYKTKTNLFEVKDKDFYLSVNPIIQFQGGKENNDNQTLFINTRGLELRGLIANKIGFYTLFTENQERPPLFVQDIINTGQAVPGRGYYKNYNGTGYDYFNSAGYFTFNVTKYIGVQFGYGNNFIGDGYRSLLLSDYSSNYLYLKLNLHIWKLNYDNIFAELTSQYNRNYGDYLRPKKYIALHHLSLNATKWLTVGAFESITFSRNDHFEFQYLNPIIFYRAVEQSLGSPDKAMVAVDAKANVAHHFQFYTTFMLNEFKLHDFFSHDGWWGNKWGLQLGGKYVDAFTVKNLDLQGEINIVRPYTYTHYDSTANYTNYNQPLADPLGANFKEYIAIARYQPVKKLHLTGKVIYYQKGLDYYGSNWGGDIFLNYDTREKEYGNFIGQGLLEKVVNASLLASYELRDNFFIDLSLMVRKAGGPYFSTFPDAKSRAESNFFSAGIRWNIGRREYDY